jgi:hypothetical protein
MFLGRTRSLRKISTSRLREDLGSGHGDPLPQAEIVVESVEGLAILSAIV